MGALDIFPISFKVRNRTIVIVGGGSEALAKARLAVKTSASVRVIASDFEADFSGLDVEIVGRRFQEADLDGAALVFVADGKPDAELAISEARRQNIPLNVVDQPEKCDFFTPAIVDRAPVSVAISTEGSAPVLARLVRAQIEAVLVPDLGLLAKVAGDLRQTSARKLPEAGRRRRFFEELLGKEFPETAFDEAGLRSRALNLLHEHAAGAPKAGQVWVVGAGPGAVDLLTLRAQRLLQSADTIIFDAEVPEALVQMGRRDARTILWEQGLPAPEVSQSQISGLLINLGAMGERVIYLMSGDPMTSGRAGAVVADLENAGIRTGIVPGVAATGTAREPEYFPSCASKPSSPQSSTNRVT